MCIGYKDIMLEQVTAQETEKGSLLFVDDERNILASLRRLFRSEGYKIHLANSGAEGLELLKKERVDLVISDMRMPEMNGAEFLSRVAEKWPGITRMLLTGYSDMGSTIDAINKGNVYKYICKPWEDSDLKQNVKLALELRQIEQERDRLLVLTREQNEELESFNTNLENLVEKRTAELNKAMTRLERSCSILKDNYSTTIKIFSNFIEMREGSLRGQSRIIATHANRFVMENGMDENDARQVYYAGMLRDVGKIGFPDRLFNKPVDQMTEEDRQEYKKHPVIGSGILMPLEPIREAAKLIRYYRERYDGKGYPHGVAGDDIPFGSRVISVISDYYTLQTGSLISKRLSESGAEEYITKNKATIYDPSVVDAFIRFLQVIKEEEKVSIDKKKKVSVSELENNMVLAEDVITRDGVLLLHEGQKFGSLLIQQITNLEKSTNEAFEIFVVV